MRAWLLDDDAWLSSSDATRCMLAGHPFTALRVFSWELAGMRMFTLSAAALLGYGFQMILLYTALFCDSSFLSQWHRIALHDHSAKHKTKLTVRTGSTCPVHLARSRNTGPRRTELSSRVSDTAHERQRNITGPGQGALSPCKSQQVPGAWQHSRAGSTALRTQVAMAGECRTGPVPRQGVCQRPGTHGGTCGRTRIRQASELR